MGSIVELGMWGHHKVGVPISARVLKSTPRVGGTYLGVFTWVYKSTNQGVFTVHSAANISSDANGQF
jgi:hypothetical protein